MNIRVEDTLPKSALHLLKHGYKFVSQEWQHAVREPLLLDQGFEKRFRESCVIHLTGWNISPEREMHLGDGLDTASGVSHEVDIVARHPDLTAILELKNRRVSPPDKNDVIVFFAKILDYLAFNPTLLLKEVCPALLSNATFDPGGIAACLGLGIHPIAPDLRPLPLLVYNARCMEVELQKCAVIAPEVRERFQDFCAQLNRISVTLNQSWLSSRCGYQSEHTIVLRAVGGMPTLSLSQEIRQLNSDCSQLISELKTAKARGKA